MEYSKKIFHVIEHIEEIKFFNTSFREYNGLYGNYVVCVAPFAILIHKITKTMRLSEGFLKFEIPFWESETYHHIDANEKNTIDPCLIYEEISGTKIHTEVEKDEALTKEEYQQNIDYLKNALRTWTRKQKIKQLSNNTQNI